MATHRFNRYQLDALQRKALGELAKAGKGTPPPNPKRSKKPKQPTVTTSQHAWRLGGVSYGYAKGDVVEIIEQFRGYRWDGNFTREHTPPAEPTGSEEPTKSEADVWLEEYMKEGK